MSESLKRVTERAHTHTRHARNVMCVYYQETEQFACALNTHIHTHPEIYVYVWIYYDDVTHTHTHTSLEGNELLVGF